jgi:hypothetical protein
MRVRGQTGKVSMNEVANMGCMELAKDAFYLIDSAVFQCMEYQ